MSISQPPVLPSDPHSATLLARALETTQKLGVTLTQMKSEAENI